MTEAVVLDAWAVVEFLDDHGPAADRVERLLLDGPAALSIVNLGEIHYRTRRLHGEERAMATVRRLEDVLRVIPADRDAVLAAARLKADFRMSYADAFAASTAIALDATLWTGDPELLVEDAAWRWEDLRG